MKGKRNNIYSVECSLVHSIGSCNSVMEIRQADETEEHCDGALLTLQPIPNEQASTTAVDSSDSPLEKGTSVRAPSGLHHAVVQLGVSESSRSYFEQEWLSLVAKGTSTIAFIM